MSESLRITHAACQAALESLHVPSDSHSTPALVSLRTDFVSLLSLIYAATTKLSLALKPSSPTYSASVAPLKDISDNVAALSHCVRLFSSYHPSTLAQEISSAARDVIISVKALLQSFIDIDARDDYLVRTGAVHEIITHIRSTLSLDNVAAVQKVLTQNHASLDDGCQEVDAMITAQNSTDDWEDDGWSELGLDSKIRMTSEELERTKKAHALLRLSTLLHKRIIKDVLTADSTKNLDSLPPPSSSLVVASDDLVSTLYTPQSPSETSKELAAFVTVIDTLRSALFGILPEPSLADQVQAMTLQPSATPQKDPMKWFQTCFAQIQKAVDNLRTTLE